MTSWFDKLDERTQKEIAFARTYVNVFGHGTDGHHRLRIIAVLADALDRVDWHLDRLEGVDRPTLTDDELPSGEDTTFWALLKSVPREDIEWLLSETLVGTQFPVDNAPLSLVRHKLVDRTMIHSGRDPKYGFQVSALGSAFAMWIRSQAIKTFLESH